MKKNLFTVFAFIFLHCASAQVKVNSSGQVGIGTENPQYQLDIERRERISLSAGLLMGGGGLIGADMEFMLAEKLALQFGAGIGSAGCGINFHFKPYINSQFISIQYFHQGFGSDHYASWLGPMYVFRAKKILQFGIGFGSILSKGPRWETTWANKKEPPSVGLMYNIGLYFPL
jgi:hypothetical protein